MKNQKNKRTTILAIILVGLIIVGYKVAFPSSDDGLLVEENISAGVRVEAILKEVAAINFNTDAIGDYKFRSLKSIETPLPSLPVGRQNPFSVISNSR